jgi:hypothetical protein
MAVTTVGLQNRGKLQPVSVGHTEKPAFRRIKSGHYLLIQKYIITRKYRQAISLTENYSTR